MRPVAVPSWQSTIRNDTTLFPMKAPIRKLKSGAVKMIPVRWQRFCESVAAGEFQTTAYLNAGFKTTAKHIAVKRASELMNRPEIIQYIADLRKKERGKKLATREFKREKLYAIMIDPESRPADIIRAIEMDCRMAGHFEPEKIELEDGPRRLANLEERASQLVASLSRFARAKAAVNGANGHSSPGTALSRWAR